MSILDTCIFSSYFRFRSGKNSITDLKQQPKHGASLEVTIKINEGALISGTIGCLPVLIAPRLHRLLCIFFWIHFLIEDAFTTSCHTLSVTVDKDKIGCLTHLHSFCLNALLAYLCCFLSIKRVAESPEWNDFVPTRCIGLHRRAPDHGRNYTEACCAWCWLSAPWVFWEKLKNILFFSSKHVPCYTWTEHCLSVSEPSLWANRTSIAVIMLKMVWGMPLKRTKKDP